MNVSQKNAKNSLETIIKVADYRETQVAFFRAVHNF